MVQRGVLHKDCARIVLKILYLARIGRPDLLWSVNCLARDVTKWTVACDKRLLRLISYIHFTRLWTQTCFVGDKAKNCQLAMFADASFAGDLSDSKSTTGGYLCLIGPRTFVPLSWICKKQTAVSHSSTEAEVISLDTNVRLEVLPCLNLLETIIETSLRGETSARGERSPAATLAKMPTHTEAHDQQQQHDEQDLIVLNL